jgi:hypothetical protein
MDGFVGGCAEDLFVNRGLDFGLFWLRCYVSST